MRAAGVHCKCRSESSGDEREWKRDERVGGKHSGGTVLHCSARALLGV
jgi:hypothetical protein